MQINYVFASIVALILMIVVPTVWFIIFRNNKKILKIGIKILAVFYFIFLFIGVTAKIQIKSNIVNINYEFTNRWFNSENSRLFVFSLKNILINIVMFFPLGFIVFAFAHKHQFMKTIMLAFILSIIIESLQFVLPISRNVEITDLLYNTISGLISASYCLVLSKIMKFKK